MQKKSAIFSIGLYALATAVVAGSNFISTALLLHMLGPEEFSGWATVEPLILLALPLSGLGVHIGLINQIGREPNVIASLMPLHLGSSIIMAAIGVGIGALIFPLLWVSLAGLILLFEGSIVFFVSYWRATNRPVTYATVEGGRTASVMLLLAALSLFPILAVSSVWQYLALRAALGGVFLALAVALTGWRWRPNLDAAIRAVRFGLPIVLASSLVTMIMNFDRYAVSWVAGQGELSAYVAHVKASQILASAAAPFFTWFAPMAISRLQNRDPDNGMFGRSFLAFASVTVGLALGLWLVAPALWPLVFPSVPYDPSIMAILIIGVAIFAAGNPLSLGSLAEGRTHHALYVTLSAGAIGLSSVLILAPLLGVKGVAIGKALGFGSYAVIFALHTWKHLRIVYPWGKILGFVALALGIAALLVEPISRLPLLPALISASAAAIVVPACAWWLDRIDR